MAGDKVGHGIGALLRVKERLPAGKGDPGKSEEVSNVPRQSILIALPLCRQGFWRVAGLANPQVGETRC